jgi:hypothetical protein
LSLFPFEARFRNSVFLAVSEGGAPGSDPGQDIAIVGFISHYFNPMEANVPFGDSIYTLKADRSHLWLAEYAKSVIHPLLVRHFGTIRLPIVADLLQRRLRGIMFFASYTLASRNRSRGNPL